MRHPPASFLFVRSCTIAAVLCGLLVFLGVSGCTPKGRMPLTLPPRAGEKPAVTPPAAVRPAVPPPVSQVRAPRSYPALEIVEGFPAELLPDDLEGAFLDLAVERGLAFFEKTSEDPPLQVGGKVFTASEMREGLLRFREILRSQAAPEERIRRLREAFDLYRSGGADGKGSVLVTGYFEPVMDGSLVRTEAFRHPLYRVPDQAVVAWLGKFGEKYRNERIVGRVQSGELVPFYSRGEIDESGILSGRNLEIAWVADPVDLYFLHIQGSGKIRLADGRILQVSYAQSNGRPFRSVARYLLDKGKMADRDPSYRAVKQYLREHPEERAEILAYNESYVFFRVVENGPVGSLGLTVTEGRSIATDPEVFPRGGVAFLRSRKPVFAKDGTFREWAPLNRFVLNQDAGGAIKGPGRVDLFCGTGVEAEWMAGSLKEKGELYFLLPKKGNDPRSAGASAAAGAGAAKNGSTGRARSTSVPDGQRSGGARIVEETLAK